MSVVRRARGWIAVRLSRLLLEAAEHRLRERRIGTSLVGAEVTGLDRIRMQGRNRIGRNTTFGRDVELGLASTIGERNFIVGPVSIGNYTQFGPGVFVYGQNHALSTLTPFAERALFDGRLRREYEYKPVWVGHSVWVGCNSVLLPGASIGNGAVIGAGSVVAGHIPPYAIAVGNPARVIRRRFDDDTIARLEAIEWWTRTPEELKPIEPVFHVDLTEQPDVLYQLAPAVPAGRTDGGARADENP